MLCKSPPLDRGLLHGLCTLNSLAVRLAAKQSPFTSGLGLVHEGVIAAEIGLDPLAQRSCGLAAATWLHVRPIEAVVLDLGSMVEHPDPAGISSTGGDEVFQALAFELSAFNPLVQVGDRGVVMPAVEERKGRPGEMRYPAHQGR